MIAFNKYQGTGNDFIIIDNRIEVLKKDDHAVIKKLCDRRFGIGADGLILINRAEGFDFEMVYFNSDGFEGSMCGNGGRCAAQFAVRNKIAGTNILFKAIDGIHTALADDEIIKLKINDVKQPEIINNNYFINTGSPHYVIFVNDPDSLDVVNEGRKIRYSADFPEGGTNVNYVKAFSESDEIYVRTYERGVENETLSCGTGVTASAIAAVLTGHFVSSPVNVLTKGGRLIVDFKIHEDKITDVWLSGPATFVFAGEIVI